MEEGNTSSVNDIGPQTASSQTDDIVSNHDTDNECHEPVTSDNICVNNKEESDINVCDASINKDKSGIVIDIVDVKTTVEKEPFVEPEPCEVNDDARSLGELDSLPVGDELALGAAGSDSGVEGCGRALSSGGGSRSCASSVVSCGSGCGSESSSLAGAPPRPRRRVNVTVAEPKRSSPVGSSTPRPVTAPRGPNLATRERARSREKPTLPEKPRPLTPKPRIRPTADLPNLVRESPALRAKPTKTSTARCRTPNSPCEEKKWPTNGPRLTTVADASATRVAADKYGTLPRRRRDPGVEPDSSPKHEGTTPPTSRRPTITRSVSSRSTTKTRVRIYAEKTTQTILIGSDIEAAFAGVLPSIENRVEVSRCHRGVQASSRDAETARLAAALAAAQAAAALERERRARAEAQAAADRAARLAALADLERNSQRLLELAGASGADTGTEGCLRALEEQLRSAGELATRQRAEIDTLREHCNKLHVEASSSRESCRSLEARLAEAEREALEMQEFLAAETGALTHSLRDAEADLARVTADLDKRRSECRQLVRMCEQRRQEGLAQAARARGGAGAAHALDALARRLARLTRALRRAYRLPRDHPTVYHNDVYSRSDSGEALSPEEEVRGGLLAAVARALRSAPPLAAAPGGPPVAPAPPVYDDDRSRVSDDNDNSADLLDSETEPCFVNDPECLDEWWSGDIGEVEVPEGEILDGPWSGDSGSPDWPEGDRDRDRDRDRDGEGESGSDSLRNLSAAIAQRQRSEEAEEAERGSLVERVARLDTRLTELLHALRLAAASAANTDDAHALALATALREKIDVTEKNVADVVVKKLAELDASKNMMEQYRQSIETLKKQLAQAGEEDDDLEFIEQELSSCSEGSRRALYSALDAAAGALLSAARGWPRLAPLHRRLERLAFALASAPPPASTAPATTSTVLHTAA